MTEQEEEAARLEIEKLMEDGVAALEDEQYELAAEIFRRVVQRAPFRHDAREYLAFALDQQLARNSGSESRADPRAIAFSSAAAATTSRSRPARFRLPGWLMASALAAAVFVVAVVALGHRYDLRGWVQSLGKPAVNPVVQKIEARFEEADDAVARGRFDEALELLKGARELAAKLDPPDPKLVESKIAEVYAARAHSFAAKRNYDRALEVALEGLTHDPGQAELNFIVGKCYERKGIAAITNRKLAQSKEYFKKAVEALEKAVAADPENLEALDLLAGCYTKVNQETKALETWQRICDIAPDSREGRRARDFLRSRRGF